jgi:diguanylate cyclase (GGDEF)-like protein
MEKRYLHRSGATIWALLSVALVRGDDGAPLHFISQVLDISQSKRLEDELRRLATEDDLTGLRNRRAFEEELAAHLRLLARHGGPSSLLFLDVDDFKTVNDTRGHHAGDELLKRIGQALRDRLRGTDVPARIGGDEFAVLLPFTGEDGARRVMGDIERALEAVAVSASIGSALLEAGLTKDDALRRADEAMYRVKQQRRA